MIRVDYEIIPDIWIAYDDEDNWCATDGTRPVVGFGETIGEAIDDYQAALNRRMQ